MSELKHRKRILLVEDQSNVYVPLIRWLTRVGYHVTLGKTYQEVRMLLIKELFHLIIVDICLDEMDKTNEDGLRVLEYLEGLELNDVMPCIILSAHGTKENVLKATQELRVAGFVEKKPGFAKVLLERIEDLFEKEIQINFEIVYDDGSDALFSAIAQDILWPVESAKPPNALLTLQIQDLFGKAFADVKALYITKMKPGLTGAALIRIRPTWTYGLGTSYVAKISRREKVEAERKHYRAFVRHYVPSHTVPQVEVVYTHHLGALIYDFAERDGKPMDEFDQLYRTAETQEISDTLEYVFMKICGYWYNRREQAHRNLLKLYYDAFNLTEAKLIERIQDVVPYYNPTLKTFPVSDPYFEVNNPITWLRQCHDACIMPVYQCITHGDLTGRNIMVDGEGKSWLIDFYRTYPSHILRDFVIMETDIKYRLMPTPSFDDFLALELWLLADTSESERIIDGLPKKLRKTAMVVAKLRGIGHHVAKGITAKYSDTQKEYLLSLLMATLNVVRLRHIENDRKKHALVSASLICEKLEEARRST